ncbi:MAG TPA: hypothetical protein VGG04_11595 [Candidatus Sulfotelmatobacter sp.]|jgi:hypothetical protein
MNPVNDDNETNILEGALRDALRREDAPPDFAGQVLARLVPQKPERKFSRDPWHAFFTQPLVRWAAFAVITASLVGGFVHHREIVRQHAQGEAAKQQLMLALRIAGSKLQMARTKVNQINDDGSAQQQDQEKE